MASPAPRPPGGEAPESTRSTPRSGGRTIAAMGKPGPRDRTESANALEAYVSKFAVEAFKGASRIDLAAVREVTAKVDHGVTHHAADTLLPTASRKALSAVASRIRSLSSDGQPPAAAERSAPSLASHAESAEPASSSSPSTSNGSLDGFDIPVIEHRILVSSTTTAVKPRRVITGHGSTELEPPATGGRGAAADENHELDASINELSFVDEELERERAEEEAKALMEGEDESSAGSSDFDAERLTHYDSLSDSSQGSGRLLFHTDLTRDQLTDQVMALPWHLPTLQEKVNAAFIAAAIDGDVQRLAELLQDGIGVPVEVNASDAGSMHADASDGHASAAASNGIDANNGGGLGTAAAAAWLDQSLKAALLNRPKPPPEPNIVMRPTRAQINAQGEWGRTALHWAAREGHIDAMHVLLAEAECDLDVADECGETPLHGAAFREQREAVLLLIEAGADIGARDSFGDAPHEKAVIQPAEMGRNTVRHILTRAYQGVRPLEVGRSSASAYDTEQDAIFRSWVAQANIYESRFAE